MSSPSLTGYSANDPLRYLGPNIAIVAIVTRTRSPLGSDIKQPNTGKYYGFGTFWLVGKNPTTGTQGDLWYLSKIEASIAYWVQLNATATVNPFATIDIFDDFIGSRNVGVYGQQSWLSGSTWTKQTTISDKDHPGVLGSPAFSSNSAGLFLGESVEAVDNISAQIFLGGGVLNVNFVINIATLSTPTNNYTFRIGVGDTRAADQVNGCYLEYTDGVNSGNWVYKTASASVRTAVNSAIPITTGWHNIGVQVNGDKTSISFTVDGLSLGAPITTNIPSLGTTPFLHLVRNAGTIPALTLLFDLFVLKQVLSTSR